MDTTLDYTYKILLIYLFDFIAAFIEIQIFGAYFWKFVLLDRHHWVVEILFRLAKMIPWQCQISFSNGIIYAMIYCR